MASRDCHLNGALQKFEKATKNPERYISSQPAHENALTSCTQTLFGLAASHAEANLNSSNPLSELITEGFDEEQIWQELELQNQPCLGTLVKHVSKAIAVRNRLHLQVPNAKSTLGVEDGDQDEESSDGDDEGDDEEDDEGEEDEGDADHDELMDSENEEENLSLTRTRKPKKASKDSDESDESDTNFDIDELHSRTKPKKKTSKTNALSEDKGGKGKASVVDDQFFRLEDMEKFLEMEDAKEAKRVRRMERKDGSDDDDDEEDDEDDEEEPVDFFEDASSDDEGFDDEDDEDDEDDVNITHKQDKKSTRDLMYGDFFAEPGAEMATKFSKKRKVRFEREDEEEEEIEEDGNEKNFEEESFEEADFEDADDELLADLRKASGTRNKDDLLLSGSESEGEDISDILGGQRKKGEDKSSFEKRQEKLRSKIKDLEQSNLAKKSWQLTGEVAGIKRPENSLLEENLEFDVRTRPAPVITEETTKNLESLIKQRVLDQAWDDVQRKAKPKEEVKEFKKRVTLDQEKSKMSLGEIYEQEYIKQTQQEAEEEKEDPLHKEIKESMDSLFIKLDALSNFHFAPKPIGPEVKIISNTPAISMEEVAPISVADSSLLAPEEIKDKEKGELKGKTERTSEDRNRDLRKKKQRQRARAKDRERKEKLVEKLNPGLGNKYSKKAAMERLEKSSKAPSSTTTIVKDMENTKGNLKSSKAFFSKLQEEVVSEVHGFKTKKKKKKVMSGTQLKL
ncbi:U3 small nucleolar ribonucleoprotein protein MPP10-like [Lytechinus variegatus]|uniref:U3 small nucleolar ribonucleoprotein protein MPP10-like n=1 Tax=Lytechinus variegatus TaxID=7654 RepID=UPI001BB29A29|nr:U3 small nucleolar ribonucleoprotein protein MPP10-like [Lytechinus variegatus]